MTPDSALASADAVIAAGVRAPALPDSTPALALAEPVAHWPVRTEHFLAAHIRWASQRLAVLTEGTEGDAERAVLDACARHYEHARIGQHTVEQLAARWAQNFLLTLRRDPPWATAHAEPWHGQPAFAVAAGPSLDKNGHLLRAAQKRGPVLAVNTSASACLFHSVRPDACVCCEAKDLSAHLLPLRGLRVPVALSACASTENWDACEPERAWGFVGHEPALVPYAIELGCPPLHFGGSVACAAVSLAIQWGCSEIVLVGQDLGYTDGRLYATGTPFEDLRAEVRDGLVHVTGASKQRHPAPVVWRAGWGDGEPVASVREMDGFAAWLSKAASVVPITNATEGGARIAGTREEPLASVIARTSERGSLGAGFGVWRSPRTRDVTLRLAASARACLAGDACMPPAGLSLLHMYCVPAVLGWTHGLPLRARKASMRAAMERGCREILEVLE